ncbi:hypothetical protein HKX48_005741 [Thoreauomyces humboldtii]|nr:hypothetical protein HKX48_005741 [Thoreauomyces humboldtii]
MPQKRPRSVKGQEGGGDDSDSAHARSRVHANLGDVPSDEADLHVVLLLSGDHTAVDLPMSVSVYDEASDTSRIQLNFDVDVAQTTVNEVQRLVGQRAAILLPASYLPDLVHQLPLSNLFPRNTGLQRYRERRGDDSVEKACDEAPNSEEDVTSPRRLVLDLTNVGMELNTTVLASHRFPLVSDAGLREPRRALPQGRAPRSISLWSDFLDLVKKQGTTPAVVAPHRNRCSPFHYTGDDRQCEDEAMIAWFIRIQHLNAMKSIYRGTAIRIGPRVGVTVMGNPDIVVSHFRKLLIPVEVKGERDVPDSTDFVATLAPLLSKMSCGGLDPCWLANDDRGRKKWSKIVKSNVAVQAFIQAYGYSCANNTTLSIFTTQRKWWFLKRNSLGDVEVSPAISDNDRTDDSEAITVLQALNFAVGYSLESGDCAPPILRAPQRSAVFKSSQIIRNRKRAMILEDGLFHEVERYHLLSHLPRFDWDVTTQFCTVRHTTLALKTVDLTEKGNKTKSALATLCNELDIYDHLRMLQGTLVPQVSLVGCTPENVALFGTTYIAGPSLSPTHRAMFPEVRLAFARLHEAGVLHHDVAPRNVIVRDVPDSDGNRIVILDFGMSRKGSDVEGDV